HAEGFAAGELKHGPIALIDEGQLVIIIVPSKRGRDSLHAKVISNIQEVRARGANTVVIAEEGDEEDDQFASEVIAVPETTTLMAPLLTTVPLHIFAMELAPAKGLDVDQPRNLAKSVTGEFGESTAILGIGTDIADVPRFAEQIERVPELLDR